MLVAYLDDSGKDPQNPVTCLAGYAASEEAWAAFEKEAEPIFQKYIGDIPLHAKDLYHGEPPYDGWPVLKKQSFIAQLCANLYPRAPLLGVSFSIRKESYIKRALEAVARGFGKRPTAYNFCMQAILNWLLQDVHVGKMANEQGLALILESGNEHNEEARLAVESIRKRYDLPQLRSLSFVGKEDCRAIQMADLFAYYTRRHNRKAEPGKEPPVDPVLQVLLEGLRRRVFVATDFSSKPKELQPS